MTIPRRVEVMVMVVGFVLIALAIRHAVRWTRSTQEDEYNKGKVYAHLVEVDRFLHGRG